MLFTLFFGGFSFIGSLIGIHVFVEYGFGVLMWIECIGLFISILLWLVVRWTANYVLEKDRLDLLEEIGRRATV